MVEWAKPDTPAAQAVLHQYTHGVVASLQLCVKHQQPMVKVASAQAIENLGLEGDRHAMPDSTRQVLLLEQETCVEYDFPPGAIRENITTRGIELHALPQGTLLQIGEAVLEMTKECEPCAMVDDVREGLRAGLKHKRGMLARVVRGGEIQVGNKIVVLKT